MYNNYASLFDFASELARLVKQIAEELHKSSHELILVIPATKKGYSTLIPVYACQLWFDVHVHVQGYVWCF